MKTKKGYIDIAGMIEENRRRAMQKLPPFWLVAIREFLAFVVKKYAGLKRGQKETLWFSVAAVIFVTGIIVFFCTIGKQEKQPVLILNGADQVVQVRLPDGTLIKRTDQRLWEYIHHKPSYPIEYE